MLIPKLFINSLTMFVFIDCSRILASQIFYSYTSVFYVQGRCCTTLAIALKKWAHRHIFIFERCRPVGRIKVYRNIFSMLYYRDQLDYHILEEAAILISDTC